jgi:Kef-type K+ transport system membrane component KefB
MVVLLDIAVLALFSFFLATAEPAVTGIGSLSFQVIVGLFEEIFLSLAAGTFFGFLIIIYLKLIQKERLLFLVVMCFGVSELCLYLHYDTMLVFVIAGLVVTQFSTESEKLITTIEDLSSVIMIIFFATAGASLQLGQLHSLWKLTLLVFLLRALFTYLSERVTHHREPRENVLRRFGSTPFISQAGLTIGLAALLQARLPGVGSQLATLTIALITLNQIVGPVLFKWGLIKAGEIPITRPQER